MRNKSLLLIFSLLLCLQTSAQQTQAFQDTTLTDEQRVDHLLSILTLDEKINLLSTDLGRPPPQHFPVADTTKDCTG